MNESIKMKNKLYIIRNKANAPDGSNESIECIETN